MTVATEVAGGAAFARDDYRAAHWFALLLPASLMAGALGSQLIGGLVPCEMCHWQRWPHYAAIAIALAAFLLPAPLKRPAVALAAIAILTSGVIGVLHAGVEYHWWPGFTPCTRVNIGGDPLEALLRAPVVRCDVPQWTLFGISLAGFNALFSLLGGATILALIANRSER